MQSSLTPGTIVALGPPLEHDQKGAMGHVLRREHSYSKRLEEGAFWLGFPILLRLVTPSTGGFEPFTGNLADAGAETVFRTLRNRHRWWQWGSQSIYDFWTPTMDQTFLTFKEHNRDKVHSNMRERKRISTCAMGGRNEREYSKQFGAVATPKVRNWGGWGTRALNDSLKNQAFIPRLRVGGHTEAERWYAQVCFLEHHSACDTKDGLKEGIGAKDMSQKDDKSWVRIVVAGKRRGERFEKC